MNTIISKEEIRAEVIRKLRAGEQTLSFSSVKRFSQSPQDLVNYLCREDVQTDAMRISNMIHCIVLEGIESFDLKYYTMPEGIKYPASKQAKNVCDEIIEGVENMNAYTSHYSTGKKSDAQIKDAVTIFENEYGEYMQAIRNGNGREVVSADEYALAHEVYDALMKNAFVNELFCDSEKEVAFDGLEIDGIIFRGFVDIARKQDGNYIEGADLKVYAYVHPIAFQRKIFQDGIHMQSAIYCNALGIPFDENRWHIIAVDKDAGNIHHQVYQMCPDALSMGWQKVLELVKWYKHCRLMDAWEESYGFFVEEDHGIFPVHCPWWYQ